LGEPDVERELDGIAVAGLVVLAALDASSSPVTSSPLWPTVDVKGEPDGIAGWSCSPPSPPSSSSSPMSSTWWSAVASPRRSTAAWSSPVTPRKASLRTARGADCPASFSAMW